MTNTFYANYLQLQVFAAAATRSNMDVDTWVSTEEFIHIAVAFRNWYSKQQHITYSGIDTLSNDCILLKYCDNHGIKHITRF